MQRVLENRVPENSGLLDTNDGQINRKGRIVSQTPTGNLPDSAVGTRNGVRARTKHWKTGACQ